MSNLKIKSHVGRDIVQSAQSFRTPEAAVWEYVVNSLQYVDKGVVPQVAVVLDPKAKVVTIADNGSGMDRVGLEHFFTMHGENKERAKGIPGRGKFGTGKSAAFGIGTALVVTTVRNEVRQSVYVDRAMIDATDGAEVPVNFLATDEPALGEPNGTVIEIRNVSVKMNREPVVSLIERHLSAFHATSPVVTVNGRICEIARPQASLTRPFTPPANLAAFVGEITLTVGASVTPLEAGHRGIQVSVGTGNLVAIVTAGVDSKQYGDRLFGSVDCLALDDTKYEPVSPYGNNRDLSLNMSHPVAQALIAFIGASLEQVRAELVEEAKKTRADADAKRLKATTDAISSVLNADLAEMRERLESPMANVRKRTKLPAPATGEEPDETSKTVDPAGEETGEITGTLGGHEDEPQPNENPTRRPGSGPSNGPGGENASPWATAAPDGKEKITAAGGTGKQRPRGGMAVETGHLGADYDRYHWNKESRVITINLDHPVVAAARALNDSEATFRRLCYEIAFTAYAIALADLQLERDTAMDASDATYEVRQALNRVWRHADALYAA